MSIRSITSPNDHISNKPLSERDTRQKLLSQAKQLGIEVEFATLMKKYEDMLKRCTNVSERNHLTILANVDIHKLFGFQNALVIDGVEIVPAQQGYDLAKNVNKIVGI